MAAPRSAHAPRPPARSAPRRAFRSALRLLAPLAWTALILWLATPEWSAARTGARLFPILRALFPWAGPEQLEAIHWLLRKGAHAVEYAVLVLLWRQALARGGEAPGWRAAFGVTVLTAGLDEIVQARTSARGGSPLDVLLDAAAAGAALGLLTLGARRMADSLTGALLWVAAAGGTVFLVLGWGAGAPLGWLAWSAPLAWVGLLLWHRRRRPA